MLPTEFAAVNNPWGDGEKPASIQPFIEGGAPLASYTDEAIRQLQATDEEFADDLSALTAGYKSMLESGICPDFAKDNLLRVGSRIIILDTGRTFPVAELPKLKTLHSNCELVESLSVR